MVVLTGFDSELAYLLLFLSFLVFDSDFVIGTEFFRIASFGITCFGIVPRNQELQHNVTVQHVCFIILLHTVLLCASK